MLDLTSTPIVIGDVTLPPGARCPLPNECTVLPDLDAHAYISVTLPDRQGTLHTICIPSDIDQITHLATYTTTDDDCSVLVHDPKADYWCVVDGALIKARKAELARIKANVEFIRQRAKAQRIAEVV